MIDHILTFASEAAAHVVLDPLGFGFPADADDPARWDTSRVIAPITVTYQGAALPGFWLAIGLSNYASERAELVALDQCSLVADRDAAERGEQFIIFMGTSTDPQVVAAATVEPTFAGSNYPFGGA